jgi:hypothetical protein
MGCEMAGDFARAIRRISRRTLTEIREMSFHNRLDWNQISKPLEEDPNDLVDIHSPTIKEYGITYSLGGKEKTCYDWWYSAILKDEKGKLYFFILAFHPKWSFYRIIRTDTDQLRSSGLLPNFAVTGGDFSEKIEYSENGDEIAIWVSKSPKSKSSKKAFAACTIRSGGSHLALKTDIITVDLTFASLGMPFWINRGREATCSPKGDTMSGFYDVCHAEGFLADSSRKNWINGVGINEHLMSFTPPEHIWNRIDGVFFCTDQIYCAFWYLENKIDGRQYKYKDGAIFIRSTKEYLIPIDFEIRYLGFDDNRKIPIQIGIHAVTTRGTLDATAQAFAETERQLALKILDGQFAFSDGRKIKLTNGYGQHALH